MKKRISVIVTMLLLLTVLFAQPVSAAETSGTCGDNLTWSIDEKGTFRLDGEGELRDFEGPDMEITPWHHHADKVKKMIIGKIILFSKFITPLTFLFILYFIIK